MQPWNSAKDRRRFPRVNVKAEVRYAPRQLASEVPPDLWQGSAVDVSRSGAALRLGHGLHRGGAIELSLLQFDPPRCVSVVGNIVHCHRIAGGDEVGADGSTVPRYLAGVQFTHVLRDEDVELLAG